MIIVFEVFIRAGFCGERLGNFQLLFLLLACIFDLGDKDSEANLSDLGCIAHGYNVLDGIPSPLVLLFL